MGQRKSGDAARVLVVDDHATFVDLLEMALSAQTDLVCVGSANDIGRGLELVEELRPDIVLMDLHFEGDKRTGLDAAAEITRLLPEARVLLLTAMADPALITRAAAAGVCWLLPKSGSLVDLLKAMRASDRGGFVVHPSLRSLVAQAPPRRDGMPALSRREREVLERMLQGFDARSTAGDLGISVATTRGYIKTLLGKLNAHSQLEAVAIARQRGLTDAHLRV